MTLHINDAGTWRDITNVYVNDAGTWRDIQEIHVNDAGTWRLVFAALAVQLLGGGSYVATANSSVISFNNTGEFTGSGPTGGASSPWNWLLSGSASAVDINVVVNSGGFTSGPATGAGVWHNLGTSRIWTLAWPGGVSSSSVSSTITLRNAITSAVLATGTFNLNTHP